MRAPIFQVDAFTTQRFAGNPAAVIVLPEFLDDAVMQAIAAENNLAETAFLVADNGDYRLRWFTPLLEVPLCGHATLASAAVVMERLQPERQQVLFHSASGPLAVQKTPSGYAMDFPRRIAQRVAAPPADLIDALGLAPLEIYADRFNYLALLDNAQQVRELKPNLALIATLDRSGVAVTAAGDGVYDFVSRYFAPAKGIPEDPVTGGAHCALAPFWAQRLNKTVFHAYQASRRGGELHCRLAGERVVLEGACVFYLSGEIEI